MKSEKLKSVVLLGLLTFLWTCPAQAQFQITTDHFYVYYDQARDTARRVADLAEEVFVPLASAFNFYDKFSRIHILVHDDRDFSNGFAFYYQNRIEIWATSLDFELRGTSDWIRQVLTHELAHIVSLKIASRGIINLGLINISQFDRNPDFIFTLPYYHLVAPSWFVEGIAQYSSYQLKADRWDTHRDMLLRMATLEDDLLSYDQMGVFSHDGLHSEMVYNQGYGLLLYIQDQYGDGKVEALTRHTGLLSFNKALKKVLGISSKQLYRDWKTALEHNYNTATRSIRNNLREGEKLIDQGYLDFKPRFSPDGTKIAFLSNEGQDFSLTELYLYDLKTQKTQKIKKQISQGVSWTPDGKKLVYARRHGPFFDLYWYDLERNREQRISANLRAKDPDVSPDGKTIVFVRNEDGSNNMGLINMDGTGIRYLTNHNDGTQYYNPRWSPDGKRILVGVFRGKDRDIGVIDADSPAFRRVGKRIQFVINQGRTTIPAAGLINGVPQDSLVARLERQAFPDSSRFLPLIHSAADERDAIWLTDGSGIIYSADHEGIFNLYEYRFESGQVRQLSNVLGGAFMPGLAPDGQNLVYAGYHAADYSLYLLSRNGSPVRMASLNGDETSLALSQVRRDYQSRYTGKPINELYNVGRYSKKWALANIIPIIGVAPPFIGDEFGLSSVDVGLLVSVGDILASDFIAGSAILGKNFKHNLDPNIGLELFYRRRLAPILSPNRTLLPSIYGFYSKRVINHLREFHEAVQDTLEGNILIQLQDGTLDTLRNATAYLDQTLDEDDTFKFDFNLFALGFELPITDKQQLAFEFAHRRYFENLHAKQVVVDNSRIYVGALDITKSFTGLDTTLTFQGELLDNARFFSANDFSLAWTYRSLKPTVDALINPTGGRLISLLYRRTGATVTDTLVQSEGRIVDGRLLPDSDTNNGLPFIPLRQDLSVNEFGLAWQEWLPMPIRRHTFSLLGLFRYRDKPLRTLAEGGGFYWPLRFYLGGLGSLRGYPYFALSGSKVAFGRASYTFPILPRIGKQFLHLYLDRLYASLFAETGSAWNFEAFSLDGFKNTTWLSDVGFELRFQIYSFYRIPLRAYFIMAFPWDDLPQADLDRLRRTDMDRYRIYFGFGF